MGHGYGDQRRFELLHWSGLQIVGGSSPEAPETVGTTPVLADPAVQNGPALHALEVVGDTAYAASQIGTGPLRLFDICDPAAPEKIVFYDGDVPLDGTVGVFDPG